jgi:hypothetical protein
MRNLKTYDGKHQNLKPIQSVTYLRNYEATNLWKKKWTLLVAARRETFEIAQPKYGNKALGSYCCSIMVWWFITLRWSMSIRL